MLIDHIKQDYVIAMKNHEATKVAVLRLLSSEIKNKEIELRGSEKLMSEEDMVSVLNKELKKRQESYEIFSNNNRPELAQNEYDEMQVILEYLPKQMTEEEIEKEVLAIKTELGLNDFGTLMKNSAMRLKGKADGKVISEVVKKVLS